MSVQQHSILEHPWTYRVTELRIDLVARQLTMTLVKAGESVSLLFTEIHQLSIDEGYTGTESGLEILDLSSSGLENTRVRVSNFEQDPSIQFWAKNVERI